MGMRQDVRSGGPTEVADLRLGDLCGGARAMRLGRRAPSTTESVEPARGFCVVALESFLV